MVEAMVLTNILIISMMRRMRIGLLVLGDFASADCSIVRAQTSASEARRTAQSEQRNTPIPAHQNSDAAHERRCRLNGLFAAFGMFKSGSNDINGTAVNAVESALRAPGLCVPTIYRTNPVALAESAVTIWQCVATPDTASFESLFVSCMALIWPKRKAGSALIPAGRRLHRAAHTSMPHSAALRASTARLLLDAENVRSFCRSTRWLCLSSNSGCAPRLSSDRSRGESGSIDER
ncbi:hypothetical protein C8Q79DRAFT_689161 [Trametes meyenii]|nr:hypothetical protein C8Q79DRAFT_689161 [Trametes meyenii]